MVDNYSIRIASLEQDIKELTADYMQTKISLNATQKILADVMHALSIEYLSSAIDAKNTKETVDSMVKAPNINSDLRKMYEEDYGNIYEEEMKKAKAKLHLLYPSLKDKELDQYIDQLMKAIENKENK